MPWDEYGIALEDIAQGVFCGFCGSRGPCKHDRDYPSDERPYYDGERSIDATEVDRD